MRDDARLRCITLRSLAAVDHRTRPTCPYAELLLCGAGGYAFVASEPGACAHSQSTEKSRVLYHEVKQTLKRQTEPRACRLVWHG